MTDFIEKAEKAIEDCLEYGVFDNMPDLLRDAIKEIRELREAWLDQQSAICNLKTQLHKRNEAVQLVANARVLLSKCKEGIYVQDIMEQTYTYNFEGEDITCDGECLLDDIDNFFLEGPEPKYAVR